MKKFIHKLSIALISVLLFISGTTVGQSLQHITANLINDIGSTPRVFHNMAYFGKTTTCPIDTVGYTVAKTTGFSVITLNASTSGNSFAQWYPAPQALTIYGFEFFGWMTAGTNAVVTVSCNLYNSTIDSMPSGVPLRTVTINIDSTFGGGTLTALRKRAVFSTPITVTGNYVLTIETTSSTSVGIVTNSWTATPADGRSEWLSSVRIGTTFFRSYNINVSSVPFNADFIMGPHVSYALTSSFTTSACNAGGNTLYFTNTSSNVLFSPFYNINAFYGALSSSCLWNFGDSSLTPNVINASHSYSYRLPYSVKLTDTIIGWRTGCADMATTMLSVAPPLANAGSNSPLCPGSTLRLHADTITGATYRWTGPNGFSSSSQNPLINGVTTTMAGNYNVIAIIGQCSSMVSTTNVIVVGTPVATNNGPVCVGQQLNLSVTSITGASYSWTGPNGFTSSVSNPSKTSTVIADSGTYSVTVTFGGCGTIGPFTTLAAVNRIPVTPTASGNTPICVGDNLNLTCSTYPSGASYSWTGPGAYASYQQNPARSSVQSAFAGTYSVTVTVNGCTSPSASTTIVINNTPSSPTVSNNGPLCAGQSLSLTATTVSGATYQWSGPNSYTSSTQNPTKSSVSTSDAGTYSVVAMVNGCSSIAASTLVSISSSAPVPTATSNSPLCPGQNLQLSASTIQGATYSWTGPNSFTSTAQNPTINAITSVGGGTYSVTATTASCGTSSAGIVTVVINPLPAAPTVSNNGPLCTGDTIRLSASAVAGAAYTWSGPNLFSSSLQNPVIGAASSATAGTYSVYVAVSGCGTSAISNTSVRVRPSLPIPTAGSLPGIICTGDSFNLTVTETGIGPNATYNWSGPNGYNSSLKNPYLYNATTNNSGIYGVLVTDSGCVSASGTSNITVNPVPASPVPSSNAPICEGTSLSLNATIVTNATTYVWSGPGGFSSTSRSVVINSPTQSANSGVYYIYCLVNGCKSSPAPLTVVVGTVPAAPVANNNGPKCAGQSLSLTASTISGVTYNWSGPNGYAAAIQNPLLTNVNPSMSGTYSVFVSTSYCSSTQATTNVVINAIPTAPVLSSSATNGNACVGDTLLLFSSYLAGGTYYWTGPAFFDTIQNPAIKNIKTFNSGTFTATISKNGCTSPGTDMNITVNPLPVTSQITGPGTVTNYETQSYSVTNNSGSVFTWLITGGSPKVPSNVNLITVNWAGSNTNASVKVTETSASGCKGNPQVLAVLVKPYTGLNELNELAGIRLYPNPSTGSVYIESDNFQTLIVQGQIMDVTGRKVLEFSKYFAQGQPEFIDLRALKSGIYIIRLESEGKTKTVKLAVE